MIGWEGLAHQMSTHTERPAEGEGIGAMLRELAGMLVETPGAGGAPARTGVSLERTAQVAGLQAVLTPLVTAPLLLMVEPTVPIGSAGWILSFVLIASVVAVGVGLIYAASVSTAALAGSNAYTAVVLALLTWLTGGWSSPFPLLFPLLASSITPHRPRVRRVLIVGLLLAICAPLLYEDAVSSGHVAWLVMLATVSTATLLTMVWLSSRVGRAETGLMDAISSARVLQQELEAEAKRLVELSATRERLVTRVSHELRTPLTSVKGYVEALLGGEGGDLEPTQRELAAVALRNTVRLEILIADLLLLSRVEAGRLVLRAERVEVRKLLETLVRDLEQLAREGDVSLIVEAPPDLAWDLDRERIEQAVTNLIANAIKYSPRGGPVLIRAREAGSELSIEVIDKGVGIPSDEIGRLGERFFRASTAGSAPGTGLGIAITQELVELHGGTLDVESEVGAGSIFRIRIPVAAP